ncbi:acetamidase/formamidase family protein [Nitrincola nitratireducens]|uniref:Transcriptional activator feaR n=1 Tax=Nitrincola nitratireducens TaxID=1229521 RepID=W9VFN1_9GAMM|nr:acetamidase/formamidase family protein [Nitrincola nitratireducens]EXJ09495.1 Transcriptional activator feaR [Nitrincola nitratireducens]
MTDLKRFSASAIPAELRQWAWNDILARLGLSSDATRPDTTHDSGYIALSVSARNSVFVHLTAAPQTLTALASQSAPPSSSTVLVLALLDGTAQVLDADQKVQLRSGDIMLLDPNQPWHLTLQTHFRTMLIKLESSSFLLRLVRTGRQEANRISTQQGIGTLCLNMLQSLTDQLAHLDRNELPALETTLAELLVACLSHKHSDALDDTTDVQLAHLRRVCRSVDSYLDDPELNIEQIAAQEGLSVRYLQKLFKNSGTTFSEYLKSRRIQHCCIDLANPTLAQFSIAQLCYRWGFNDAANFSRTFSQIMGMSPKNYRAAPPQDLQVQLQRGCPQTKPSTRSAYAQPQNIPLDNAIMQQRKPFQEVLDDHARYVLSLKLAPKRLPVMENTPPTQSNTHTPRQYYLPASDKTVHWGYFSNEIKPVLNIRSGDIVTIETLSQHATDDSDRMIDGDPGAQSVFHWTRTKKNVDRRGAGPMDASIFGRGAGEGFGVHICTGPIYVTDAEPGDVLEVRILDIQPRLSCNPLYLGKHFGSNAATWWGFQYDDLLTTPKKREVVTLYEVHQHSHPPHAKAIYNFRWTPQTDPYGIEHPTIDYPGVPVDHTSINKQFGILENATIPVRPHFGVMAVAPRESGIVDSIPPSYFGGNMDNWRAGKGTQLFLPVAVPGALFSVGDPHASQGDSELCGTAIECSLTGIFQLVLHKKQNLSGSFMEDLSHPFLETPDEWVLQGMSFSDYQAELGPNAQTQVYKNSSLEAAMRDAFRKARHYLMKEHKLSEDEAISLISVAVDFGITQVVDGNLGVHAIIRKAIFPDYKR